MASVESVLCAWAGGSSGAWREQMGRGGQPGRGSRPAFAGGVMAGVDPTDLSCLLLASGLGGPQDGQAVRGRLVAAAQAQAALCAREWPQGMAIALAWVAARELAAGPAARWSDAMRRAAVARIGVRVSQPAWSQTWAARYRQVLGVAWQASARAGQWVRG